MEAKLGSTVVDSLPVKVIAGTPARLLFLSDALEPQGDGEVLEEEILRPVAVYLQLYDAYGNAVAGYNGSGANYEVGLSVTG
ncbi:hypothetical protein MD537_25490, partial [Flavihumibacter sediminis]|nr:hypothetical protein [Flavihumibacter sediminis]